MENAKELFEILYNRYKEERNEKEAGDILWFIERCEEFLYPELHKKQLKLDTKSKRKRRIDPRYEYLCLSYYCGCFPPEDLLTKLKNVTLHSRSKEALYKNIVDMLNTGNPLHLNFITLFTYFILSRGVINREKLREIIIKNNIYYFIKSPSKLEYWKEIFEQLGLGKKAESCCERILEEKPQNVNDVVIKVKELIKRGLYKKIIPILEEEWVHPILASEIKKKGDKEEYEKVKNYAKNWLAKYPENKGLFETYLDLIKKREENEGEIKEAIEYTISWLKDHPGDNKIRSFFLGLVRDKGFLKRYIEPVLADAEEWMKKHDPYLLFKDYITLIEKVSKTEINVEINDELVRKFGYNSLNSWKWGDSVLPIKNFAEWLVRKGYSIEAKQIYEKLLKIKVNPKTMSTIRLSYGKVLLGEAMDLGITDEERIEKLKKAEKEIREALKFHKGNHIARVFLAVTLKEQGEQDKADYQLKEAERWRQINEEEKPLSGEIPYKIAIFYFEFKQYEESVNWLRIAVAKEPEHWANYFGLGNANKEIALSLEKKGSFKEARDTFTEALFELETAWEKAPKLLQLPAKEEIPANIEECRKQLEFLKEKIQEY